MVNGSEEIIIVLENMPEEKVNGPRQKVVTLRKQRLENSLQNGVVITGKNVQRPTKLREVK